MAEEAAEAVVETGTGIFEYKSGARYEGDYKIVEGVKKRHGQGKYTYPRPTIPKPLSGAARMKMLSQSPAPSEVATTVRGSQIRLGTAGSQATLGTVSVFQNETESEQQMLTEEYDGQWEDDVIHGFGIYTYKNEDVYEGMWSRGKYHGQGTYHFASGAKYTGDWENHRMHGIGTYTDENGMEWSGIYIEGTFDSQIQKRLAQERVINQKCDEIRDKAVEFLNTCRGIFEKEKKTWKAAVIEILALTQAEEAAKYVSEPYSKFEDRPPDKWNEVFGLLVESQATVLRKAEDTELLGAERILGAQLEGIGQIVEFKNYTEQRKTDCALLQIAEDTWCVVQITDALNK